MKFKGLDGRERTLKAPRKYLIDWDSDSCSKFQTRVKEFLKPYWSRHVVFEELRIVGTRLSLDFYNATRKVAVEVQGAQHTQYVKFFHGKNRINFLNQLKRDQKTLDFCDKNGIILVEVYPADEICEELFQSSGVIL